MLGEIRHALLYFVIYICESWLPKYEMVFDYENQT